MVLNLRPQGFGIVYGFLQKIVKLVSIDTISDPSKAPWEDKKRIYSGNLAPVLPSKKNLQLIIVFISIG
ncbi:hypothetical protein SAMN04487870_3363 [Pseudoalteromonas sp. DSM 26666]|nr:hypothetical protein SAMN04487870_3363 [Pseudoalteromonas sp. DSM 26666]